MSNTMVQTTPSPIATAVEPLRGAAVARAVTRAREIAENVLARYATHPADFLVPHLTFTNKREHAIKSGNWATLCALTVLSNPGDYKSPRVRSEARIERFVVEAGENASSEYTAFIAKLETKIGACDAAELQGEHVWGYSVLTVRKGETAEAWRTHQIINVSKLGKVFNQWPTRKASKRGRR